MLRPWPVCSMCCCRNHFLLFFIFFGHVMATAKIQPQEMNFCDLGFGKLVLGIFKGHASHYLAATKKYPGTRNENVGFRAGKLVSRACVPLSGHSRPPNKPATGNENGEIVLGSFQALVPPYLAAAGHQKIQPQEMRI